jgi:protein-disulfide isomerase
MKIIGRRTLLVGSAGLLAVGAAVLSFTGCTDKAGGGASSPDDIALGPENAPATLIEYASVTCPHCAEFHETVFEQLKTNYIDTGKLRFVLREYPAPANLAPIAVAGFQVARCGGADPDTYYTRIGVLMTQQHAILGTGTMDGVRGKLVEIGAAAGLSEQQVLACISDEAGAERIRRIIEGSNEFQISGTPTLILNGTKLEDPSVLTYEGLTRAIDAAIAGS